MHAANPIDAGLFDRLDKLRAVGGKRQTVGLPDETLKRFALRDPRLFSALDDAIEAMDAIRREDAAFVDLDEVQQIETIQRGYVNFYQHDAVNPYVSVAACGPWVVTSKGAVVHDSGGYGMLGMGHAPAPVLDAMGGRQVMANIMTANYSQLRLVNALRAEIGHRRDNGCPYDRFVCMNSGSESVTVAARISDVNAKLMTDPGGRHEGKTIGAMALRGAFHGRTERPAQFSDASIDNYREHLASFRAEAGPGGLITVEPNNCEELAAAFEQADKDGIFIEAMFMEPVMGEGNPGMAVSREFYDLARKLTRERGTLLLMDSIQAGLRSHGCLSVVDYPGFEDCDPPDMETYSKALNAGQYPFSVLALDAQAATLYRRGIYGNTMTTNPRAMDVACAVLESITPALRANIQARGKEFLDKLGALKEELVDKITLVQGTGLLFSCELDGSRYKSYGSGSIEEYMRKKGIGVIHGGENSLRFTPNFDITSEEVDLVVSITRDALINGPERAPG